MRKDSDKGTVSAGDVWERIRGRIREAIETVMEEELAVSLAACPGQRTKDRQGYRHGAQVRRVATQAGPMELAIPRGRVFARKGGDQEWHSGILPRYQRRTHRVDEAILGTYLAGANTRRIRKALGPVLGEEFLSRNAISRIVGRLHTLFDAWKSRDLSGERCVYLYMDAIRLPVRMARRVGKMPIQAVLGVREDGQKVLLSLEIAASESTASWAAVVKSLTDRKLPPPKLVIVDGNAGLIRAVKEAWPGADVQRCVKHKLENLLAKAPKHCHAELKRDYGAIPHAASPEAAHRAYDAFLRKWRGLCQAVAESLEEAGKDLLTFTRFPKSQWRAIRTTNAIERLNGEFRRRTKTQGSFRNERSALVLLWGLVAFGQVCLRKIDGWKEVAKNLYQAA